MSDDIKHECAVAMVVLRKPPSSGGDFGGTKLSLLLEKQHNRGQDGAGAAILSAKPQPGSPPYMIFKSASDTPLTDVLGMIGKRSLQMPQASDAGFGGERIFLGHLRYATFGKNELQFCHPFVHQAGDLKHTLLLVGNFNLANAAELFENFTKEGAFPVSKSDGYLVTELIAANLKDGRDVHGALAHALENADGAWVLCGATGDGWAFATRDPHGIRPCFYYIDESAIAVASERPAIQAAFDVAPDAVKELPQGSTLLISPDGETRIEERLGAHAHPAPCSFERIYFSRANDAQIHRERKALGAALLPRILDAAGAPLENVFFSYIPNSARIAFHGLLEELFRWCIPQAGGSAYSSPCACQIPRFGEIAVKDAKFRTFIADAAARREFYKHVYDVTYGLVRPGKDVLAVLDDSIVRGNTMKNAILPMLDRLGPKRIVVASSAPAIRYPDCYGIDMSSLGELVAFKALVNLLDAEIGEGGADRELRKALDSGETNPLAALYGRFSAQEHENEVARLLSPPELKADVSVVYQSVESLQKCLAAESGRKIGDWYFTGEYPTPGGYKVLRRAIENYLQRKTERPY